MKYPLTAIFAFFFAGIFGQVTQIDAVKLVKTGPAGYFYRANPGGTANEWVSPATARADLNYWIQDGGNVYRTGGFVGINGPSGGYLLEVTQGNNQYPFGVRGTNNPAIYCDQTNGTILKMQAGSSSGLIGTQTDHPLYLYTSNSQRAVVTNNGDFALGESDASGFWAPGVGFGTARELISAQSTSTSISTAKQQLVIFNPDQTQGNMSVIGFGTNQVDPNRVTTSAIFGIHQPCCPRTSGYNMGVLAFATNDGGNLSERMRITESGNALINTTTGAEKLTVNGNIRASGTLISDALIGTANRLAWATSAGVLGFADAAVTSNSTQVGITAQGTRNLRLGSGGYTLIATGADKNLQVNEDGSFQPHSGLSANPSSPTEGSIWYRGDLDLFKMMGGASAKTFAMVEDHLQGNTWQVVTASTHTLSGQDFQTRYSATSNDVVVTLGDDLVDGIEYTVRCTGNGTNTVTFNAGGSNIFYVDTKSTTTLTTLVCGGVAGTGIEAPNRIYHIKKRDTVISITN